MDALAEQVVDAINDISGSHAGHRAAHTEGDAAVGYVHSVRRPA